MKPTKPSAGAMKAAMAILNRDMSKNGTIPETLAQIIDQESGLAELIEAATQLLECSPCQNGCRPDDMTCASSRTRAALIRATLTKAQENALAVGPQKPRW